MVKTKPKSRPKPQRSNGTPQTRLPFPAPGPYPQFALPARDEQDLVRMRNELHDWEMSSLIHRAVHTNDPEARELLAGKLSHDLRNGRPVRMVSRRWLSWVLEQLSDDDRLPHLAKGNTIKSRELAAFIERLVEVMEQLSPGTVTTRLHQAAKMLGVSFEKARAAYYSESYKSWKAIADF